MAKGGAGGWRIDGAGVIGENDAECEGEVGREKAVKGRTGGSIGEDGEAGGSRAGPGNDGCLSRGWVDTMEEVNIELSSVVEREAS